MVDGRTDPCQPSLVSMNAKPEAALRDRDGWREEFETRSPISYQPRKACQPESRAGHCREGLRSVQDERALPRVAHRLFQELQGLGSIIAETNKTNARFHEQNCNSEQTTGQIPNRSLSVGTM